MSGNFEIGRQNRIWAGSILLGVFVVATLVVSRVLAVETTPLLWLNPASANIPPMGSMMIDVQLDYISDVYGMQMTLSFDPAVLEVLDADGGAAGVQISPGSCPQPDFEVVNSADNDNGLIEYAVTQLSTAHPDPCSGGIVASIEFRCLMEGAGSKVIFDQSIVSDPDGVAITHETQAGFVSCQASVTETPTNTLISTSTATEIIPEDTATPTSTFAATPTVTSIPPVDKTYYVYIPIIVSASK